MDKIALSLQSISLLINSGETKKARERLVEFEREYPNNKTLMFYKPGFLIDIGSDLKDENVIKEGIDLGQLALTKTQQDKAKAYLLYCLANGYTCLYQLTERMGGVIDRTIPQSENLFKAKQHLLQATAVEIDDPNLEVQLLVNLGNCLDTLGRSIEAMNVYDKALDLNENFSMAIANKAKALRAFAEISDKYRAAIYVEAYQDIKSVIGRPDLVAVGGLGAKQDFEHELSYIESRFQDKTLLQKKLKHPRYKTANLSDFEKFYLEFCNKEKL